MGLFREHELSEIIGQIYDCAVDPTLWAKTLTQIRDRMQYAYVLVNVLKRDFPDSTLAPGVTAFQTDWPEESFRSLMPFLPKMAAMPVWMTSDIDHPVAQLDIIDEDDLKKTDYYKQWAEPHDIRDYCHANFVGRPTLSAALGASIYKGRRRFDETDFDFFRLITPHIRRSILISGLLDEGKLQQQLYKKLLDRIGTGVLLVRQDAQLVYANEIAESILSQGKSITLRKNQIIPVAVSRTKAFTDALDRACTENDADIGTFGNGIPLTGADGSVAVCYVLPLGKSERRRELGPGLAAVFITTQSTGIPPALEVLSALSGLTSREARIALLVADGQSPQETAQTLGISVHTVRTHLAHVFEKTGTNSQMALGKFIGKLSLPVIGDPER